MKNSFRAGGFKEWLMLGSSIGLPVLVFFGWSLFAWGETAELAWRDFLYTLRGSRETPNNVVIVAVDDPSFQEIGLKWPWPRRLHALLIEELSRSGASAVAFDILFAEPSTEPADDQALADAARRAGNVIFGSHISQVIRPDYQQTLRVEPLAMLVDAAETTGMVSIFPDPDGIIRTGVTHIEGEPSLAYAAAETAGRIASPRASGCCDSLFLIDFFGPSATMKTVSYYQVIGKSLPADFFKEKIVLVGHGSDVSADVGGAVDAYPSPFFRFSRKMMYGVEIHANIVETLIARCPLQAVSGPWQVPLFLLLAWAPVLVRKRPVFLTVLTSGIVLGLAGGSIVLFLYADLMMDVVPATAAAFGSGLWVGMREYRITAREKKQLRQAFSIYVAPAVVNEVLRNPDLLRLGGQKKELTVLFSDIRGFTSLSEKLDPERLVLLLNHYLSRMTDTVFNHNGTLDKYMGDAVMAIFGAPLPSDTHAISACQAALDMLSALDAAEAEWKSMGFPPFRSKNKAPTLARGPVMRSILLTVLAGFFLWIPSVFGELRTVELLLGFQQNAPAWPEAVVRIRRIPGANIYRIWLESDHESEVTAELAKQKGVVFIERAALLDVLDSRFDPLPLDSIETSNPIELKMDDWQRRIRLRALAELGDGRGVVIAVIDTGIDLTLPFFVSRVRQNPDETPGDGVDNDADGYIDDHIGWDFGDMDNDPQDEAGHGTAVASVLLTVAPGAEILPLKVNRGSEDRFSTGAVVESIYYAVGRGADVINMSLAMEGNSIAVQTAIRAAYQAGIILTAAAGNSGTDVAFPARMPEVIAVGAIDGGSERAWFSSTGAALDMTTIGTQMEVIGLRGIPRVVSGTSFSTAVISGAIAVLWSMNPHLKPQTLKNLLFAGTKDLGDQGRDPEFGAGALNGDLLRRAAVARITFPEHPFPMLSRGTFLTVGAYLPPTDTEVDVLIGIRGKEGSAWLGPDGSWHDPALENVSYAATLTVASQPLDVALFGHNGAFPVLHTRPLMPGVYAWAIALVDGSGRTVGPATWTNLYLYSSGSLCCN